MSSAKFTSLILLSMFISGRFTDATVIATAETKSMASVVNRVSEKGKNRYISKNNVGSTKSEDNVRKNELIYVVDAGVNERKSNNVGSLAAGFVSTVATANGLTAEMLSEDRNFNLVDEGSSSGFGGTDELSTKEKSNRADRTYVRRETNSTKNLHQSLCASKKVETLHNNSQGESKDDSLPWWIIALCIISAVVFFVCTVLAIYAVCVTVRRLNAIRARNNNDIRDDTIEEPAQVGNESDDLENSDSGLNAEIELKKLKNRMLRLVGFSEDGEESSKIDKMLQSMTKEGKKSFSSLFYALRGIAFVGLKKLLPYVCSSDDNLRAFTRLFEIRNRDKLNVPMFDSRNVKDGFVYLLEGFGHSRFDDRSRETFMTMLRVLSSDDEKMSVFISILGCDDFHNSRVPYHFALLLNELVQCNKGNKFPCTLFAEFVGSVDSVNISNFVHMLRDLDEDSTKGLAALIYRCYLCSNVNESRKAAVFRLARMLSNLDNLEREKLCRYFKSQSIDPEGFINTLLEIPEDVSEKYYYAEVNKVLNFPEENLGELKESA